LLVAAFTVRGAAQRHPISVARAGAQDGSSCTIASATHAGKNLAGLRVRPLSSKRNATLALGEGTRTKPKNFTAMSV
jgi:hypothetical protein